MDTQKIAIFERRCIKKPSFLVSMLVFRGVNIFPNFFPSTHPTMPGGAPQSFPFTLRQLTRWRFRRRAFGRFHRCPGSTGVGHGLNNSSDLFFCEDHFDGTLRIQVCPKKGISPTILLGGWDLDHQSYSREGSGFLGVFTTVDGSEIRRSPPGMYKTKEKLPISWCRISAINSRKDGDFLIAICNVIVYTGGFKVYFIFFKVFVGAVKLFCWSVKRHWSVTNHNEIEENQAFAVQRTFSGGIWKASTRA